MTIESVVGGPPVLVTLSGQQLPADRHGAVAMRHGRDDTEQQPKAAVATVTIYVDALVRLPTVGDPLLVELTPAALAWAGLTGAAATAARVRFTGHVTDVVATPDLPDRPATVRVTAVSRRARLGRAVVGDAPWPQELDGARAARILAVAAPMVGAQLGTIDPGAVTVLPRDVDAQPAQALLDELALHADAVLVEQRDGRLAWHDAHHRNRRAVDVTLTASQVLADVEAVHQLAGVVNQLRVTYGRPRGPFRVFTGEGWTLGAYGSSTVTNGVLRATATSNDPALTRAGHGAGSPLDVVVRAGIQGGTTAAIQLYYALNGGGYSEAQSARANGVPRDGVVRDHQLTMPASFAGNVTGLRLDIGDEAGQVIELHSLTIGPMAVEVTEGGTRPVVTYTDPASVADYGPFTAQLTSQLATEADALDYARRAVGRRSRPAWTLSQLQLDLAHTVDPVTAGKLLQLDQADLLGVEDFPTTGPFAARQRRLWVEGWSELVGRHGWQLQLSVTDYGRSGTEPRWVDLNPVTTWADGAAVTWLQAVSWDTYATT